MVQFARTNLARVDRHAPFWPDDKGSIVTQADKVVVETALLALLASRVSGAGQVLLSELESLISEIAIQARSESNRVRLLRFPQSAASIGIAHICLSHLGHGDEAFEALIRRAFASGHVDAIERLPYRSMDLAWLRGIHDPNTPPNFQGLLQHSILLSRAHPVYMAEIDAYAITHAIMYLTDFGTKPLPPSISQKRVSEMVDSCLAWHLLAGNFDLLGELLISAALVDHSWSPYARITIRMLTSVFDEFGFLPSATFDTKRYRELGGDEASAYAFHHIYHSTYVAGILCQVLLGCRDTATRAWTSSVSTEPSLLSECESAVHAAHEFCAQSNPHVTLSPTPWSPVPVDMTLQRTISRIRKYPGVCGREGAPWIGAVDRNADIEARDLSLVLNDALLVLAARDYNLAVLAAALLDRAESDLPPSGTLLEATAFLLRQQLPSGAIGAYFVVPENCSAPQAADITRTFADCIARLAIYLRAMESRNSTSALKAGCGAQT